MHRTRPLRAPFVVTVSAITTLAGCGGQTSIARGGTTTSDGGTPGDATAPAEASKEASACGSTYPAPCDPGQSCPTGAYCTCDFMGGGPGFQSCRSGVWCVTPQNPPAPLPGDCPASLPTPGTPCTRPMYGVCKYTCAGNAPATAICQDGVWCGDTASDCQATGSAACPGTVPTDGASCSQQYTCFYSMPPCQGTTASCDGTKWTVTVATCPDGGTDAGADSD